MILAKKEILAAIKEKKLNITPLEPSLVGACSIDLRLGNYFRKLKKGKKVNLTEQIDENSYSNSLTVRIGKKVELKPGEMVLGTTLEKIKLPSNLCGILEGRSRFARAGLAIHISSSLVKPGVDNVQVLELVNLSQNALLLAPGTRICQIYFETVSSPAEFRGKFKFQRKP